MRYQHLFGILTICLLSTQMLATLARQKSILEMIQESHSIDTFAKSSGYSCFNGFFDPNSIGNQPGNPVGDLCRNGTPESEIHQVCVEEGTTHTQMFNLASEYSASTPRDRLPYVPVEYSTEQVTNQNVTVLDDPQNQTLTGPWSVSIGASGDFEVSIEVESVGEGNVYSISDEDENGPEITQFVPVTYTDDRLDVSDVGGLLLRRSSLANDAFTPQALLAPIGGSRSNRQEISRGSVTNVEILTQPNNGIVTASADFTGMSFNFTSTGTTPSTETFTYQITLNDNSTHVIEGRAKTYDVNAQIVAPINGLYVFNGSDRGGKEPSFSHHRIPFSTQSLHEYPMQGSRDYAVEIDIPEISSTSEEVRLEVTSTWQELYTIDSDYLGDTRETITPLDLVIVGGPELEIANPTGSSAFTVDDPNATVDVPVQIDVTGIESSAVEVIFEVASDTDFDEILTTKTGTYVVPTTTSGTTVTHTFAELPLGEYNWRVSVQAQDRPVDCPAQAEYDPPIYIFLSQDFQNSNFQNLQVTLTAEETGIIPPARISAQSFLQAR